MITSALPWRLLGYASPTRLCFLVVKQCSWYFLPVSGGRRWVLRVCALCDDVCVGEDTKCLDWVTVTREAMGLNG